MQHQSHQLTLKEYCIYTDQQAFNNKGRTFPNEIKKVHVLRSKGLQGQKKAERT
jgi:hypothetical protein